MPRMLPRPNDRFTKRNIIKDSRNGKSARRVLTDVNFPGGQRGATIDSVRNFINSQAKLKGFRFTGGIGTQNFKLDISGEAEFFLGIQFNSFFDADCTLTINNEVVLESVPVLALVPSANPRSDKDYFMINRPLSGSDDVKLSIDSLAVYTNTPFTLYYI